LGVALEVVTEAKTVAAAAEYENGWSDKAEVEPTHVLAAKKKPRFGASAPKLQSQAIGAHKGASCRK
jgi:hypothetical protein